MTHDMPGNGNLSLGHLPDLPQTPFLKEVVGKLWQRSEIVAVWLGGSLASGKGDLYSDIDLRVAVAPEDFAAWEKFDLTDIFGTPLAHHVLPFGEEAVLHHLLVPSGDIYDLYVQSTPALTSEVRLVLGCRDERWAELLTTPPAEQVLNFPRASADAVEKLIGFFWLNTHKARKVLYRGLDTLAWEGLNRFRPVLMRLLYIRETGRDCGDISRLTIHSMTPISRTLDETDLLETIGLPTRNRDEMFQATDRLNASVAKVGRDLAERYGFAYPEALEELVLKSWADFNTPERNSPNTSEG